MMAVASSSNGDAVLLSYDPIREESQQTERPIIPNFKGSADNLDSYTQGIELSNACRRFYVTRLQVAEGMKSKLDTELTSSGHQSLDHSMGKLRHEVVSLIDQDLSLMKQLLTLNERIEDLKWQRKFAGYSPVSMTTCASSGNMLDSDGCMLSDWDGGDSASLTSERLTVPRETASDKDLLYSKYLSPSNLSVFRECAYNSTHESIHEAATASAADVARATRVKMSQQRSTSDLGSSDELVSVSVTDVTKNPSNFRLSQADSSISMDCSSNSSSLKKSDPLGRPSTNLQSMLFSKGQTHFPDHLSVKRAVDIRVHVENDEDNEFTSQETSHDSGIQVVDHNMEMII